MTPEVAQRLKEISVDVKTVALVKKPDMTGAPAAAANLGGKWTLVADAGNQITIAMELKQDGASFTGGTFATIGSGTIEGGKVSGNNFTALLKADIQGQIVELQMEGKIDGNKMSGTFSGGGFGSIPFTATKD
jgi:peroxiredoxin